MCGLNDYVENLQVDAEFWVQSPRLPTRNVKFLRFSKMMENRTWAVVDVSVNGNNGVEQESSGTSYMGHRLLPSGCLLEDMSGGFCKVLYYNSESSFWTTMPSLNISLLFYIHCISTTFDSIVSILHPNKFFKQVHIKKSSNSDISLLN